MTKAEKLLSKECNRYVNGICTTANCAKRGNPNPSIPLDFNKSTCEIHEAILEIKDLEEEIRRTKEENERYFARIQTLECQTDRPFIY